jgi:uncharacterized protein (DUF1015 family)
MPRFEPFRGLRYRVQALHDRGCSLDRVVAPPYDVIEPEERDRLAARSAYNSVRVELPVDEPGLDRYQAAASLLSAWETEGVLARDPRPVLYGYRMSSSDGDGPGHRLTGVIGALGLEPLGQGDVLPHERTLPKPLGDRFELLRACQANTSPIWGLSAAEGLSRLIGEPPAASIGEPPATSTGEPPATSIGEPPAASTETATDDEGVVHTLWPLTDAAVIDAICTALASRPLVIADGHHRYETALAYEAETAGVPDRPPGAGSIMTLVVELDDDQLWVRPIHRILEGLDGAFDLVEALSGVATLEPVGDGLPGAGGGQGSGDPASQLPLPGFLREPLPAPFLVAPEGVFALRWRPDQTPVDLDADSSHLDLALAKLPPHQLSYTDDEGAVLEAVRENRARAGFLLRPVAVNLIAEAARDHRRFPPKTSFFSPKPRTGMVFRPLSA